MKQLIDKVIIAEELYYFKLLIESKLMEPFHKQAIRKMIARKREVLNGAWYVGTLLRAGRNEKNPDLVQAAMDFRIDPYQGPGQSVLSQDEIDMVEAGLRSDGDAWRCIMEAELGGGYPR